MPARLTLLMQITTEPADRGAASPHSGGWSESVWSMGAISPGHVDVIDLAHKRATLLPKQGSVVGLRISNYNIVGNRLEPLGSSTGKLQLPGSASRVTDMPQCALEMTGQGNGVANSSRFAIRGIPDDQIKFGEYQPDASFKGLVTAYCNELANKGWRFLGRNLSLPSVRVNSIAGNVVTLNAALGAVAGTSYIRFRRVYDDDGASIQGAYMVTGIAGLAYTLAGFPARTLTAPSGTVRLDEIDLIDFFDVQPSRAVVRKIGRPFESYRGRQSRR